MNVTDPEQGITAQSGRAPRRVIAAKGLAAMLLASCLDPFAPPAGSYSIEPPDEYARIGTLDLLVALDIAMTARLNAPSDLRAGVEIRRDVGTLTFAGRGGYKSLADRDGSGTRRGTVGLGAGVGIGPVAADFAFTFGTVLGDDRFISLSFRW